MSNYRGGQRLLPASRPETLQTRRATSLSLEAWQLAAGEMNANDDSGLIARFHYRWGVPCGLN